jgi:Tol biopolymer transport system component
VIKKLFFLLFLNLPLYSSAQYFISGQDPSKIKWDQINSENFQIIYPQNFKAEAQRLANSLEAVYNYNTYTLKIKPKKISVILHNFSSVSNAFVAWAPKRSEFYTMPPQDIYPQDWMDQLALHEYRHVVQLSTMYQGFTKILFFLFGEQAMAGVIGLYVPFWFLEGDAVCSETALSQSGRGRLPEFEMRLRAQVLQRKIYPYEKAVFGSYKDFVPDRYVLGYQLVANARKRYGPEIWDKTLNQVARHPIALFPFSHGIRKGSGLSKWKYYKSCLHELDSLWSDQKSKTSYTPFRQLNLRPRKVYTNYRFPQFMNDSQTVALKSGLADITEYVLLHKDGTEKRIFRPGFLDPVWLSARRNKIVWSEFSYDKRWENRTWYDIISYDVTTGKRKRLTRKRFLFAPRLSDDASKIAVVEVSPENNYALVIIDANTGKDLKRISPPENQFLQTPTWSEDGKELIVILLNNYGKGIASIDLETDSFKLILPYSYKDITQAVKKGGHLYYHGIYSGIDNIYDLEISSGKVSQITSSPFGAFDPELSQDGKTLLYSDYSAMGFNVASMDLHYATDIPVENVKDYSVKLYNNISAQEMGILNFDSLPSKEYSLKRYRKFPHLINIHSWAPVSATANNYNINPGITLLSQNKLSTAVVQANYIYNYNERAGGITTSVIYQAWYPVISLSTSNKGRAGSYIDAKGASHRYTWHENNYGLRISQSLNLTRGKYLRNINFALQENYQNISAAIDAPLTFSSGSILSGELAAGGYRLLKVNSRDMRTQWGQSFLVNYISAQAGDFVVKNLFSTEEALYMPGLLKHHSLKLTGVYQWQGKGRNSFSSPVNLLRGFSGILGYKNFMRFSADYKLPLAYPDLRLGPVLYLQRIKANLFYDYGYAEFASTNFVYNSLGVEITNDIHLFNFIAPIDIGFRYLYKPQLNSSLIQFLFNINVNAI